MRPAAPVPVSPPAPSRVSSDALLTGPAPVALVCTDDHGELPPVIGERYRDVLDARFIDYLETR